MKRILATGILLIVIYACNKTTDVVYDSHLFQALQAQNWIFDSAKITDSLSHDSAVYATDTTINEVTKFTSQQYSITTIRLTDSLVLDTITYQIIYDSPSRIYFYDNITQQITRNQYLDIDTVNTASLILTQTDTFKAMTRSYYHAK